MKQVFSKIITKFALFVQKRQKYFRTRAICALQKGSFPHGAHIHAPRKNFAPSKIVRGKIRWGVRYAPEKSKGELSRPGKLQGGVKCALPENAHRQFGAPAPAPRRPPAAQAIRATPAQPRHRHSPGTGTAPAPAQPDAPPIWTSPAPRAPRPAAAQAPQALRDQLRRPKTRSVILNKWYKCILCVFPT